MSGVVWVSETIEVGDITLTDYSIDVKNIIREKALQFLEEAGNEVVSTTIRNSTRNTGQTASTYQYTMDEADLGVHIGSDYENAIWEEFGTGEFAEKKNGRKGWWVYIEGATGNGTGGKVYATLKEAKKAMRFLIVEKGLPAHVTKGKKARRPFRNAYMSTKLKIIKRAEQIFGELGK